MDKSDDRQFARAVVTCLLFDAPTRNQAKECVSTLADDSIILTAEFMFVS